MKKKISLILSIILAASALASCARMADPTDEDITKAITTQYGKCIYKCDNDVVDHQTVNMLFEDGITFTFTMNAFDKDYGYKG